MIDVYQKLGRDLNPSRGHALIAIQRVPKSETHLYGIIRGKKVADRVYRVEEMVEKPEKGRAPSNLAIIGRYILPPEILDILGQVREDRRGEIQLTDGLKELSRSIPIFGYEFYGDRYDAGDKLGYLQANVSFGLKHPELGPKLKRFLRELSIK
jgi:UTP--glucose-1-phosphate uridylyltransferase